MADQILSKSTDPPERISCIQEGAPKPTDPTDPDDVLEKWERAGFDPTTIVVVAEFDYGNGLVEIWYGPRHWPWEGGAA